MSSQRRRRRRGYVVGAALIAIGAAVVITLVVVGLKEVSVDVQLTLSSASGQPLSTVQGHADSYSGVDTLATATALMRRQADQLVAQLYNDYCRKAGR